MIRLYGHKDGQGSFVQVTRGLRLALEATGLFAGLVPIDTAFNDTEEYGGALAAVGLNAGAPGAVIHSHRMGRHKQRWLLLAPNSDRIPSGIATAAPGWLDGILAPSSWAVSVCSSAIKLPVLLCPHGVHPEYRVVGPMRATVRELFRQGEFRVLHLASTSSERKGTRELLAAWKLLLDRNRLPPKATLVLVMPAQGIEQWKNRGREIGPSVQVAGAERGHTPTAMAMLYGYFHVVCQPSRAEGFGLAPLEARACGVPIVATRCTGHSEHVHQGDPGVVSVLTGPEAPIDDMTGAVAPSLEPENVAAALEVAYGNWEALADEAERAAERVAEEWSWARKSGPALRAIVEGCR